MTNLYLYKDLCTIRLSLWGERKPDWDDHIGLVVVLWRCLTTSDWPKNGHLIQVDCSSKSVGSRIEPWGTPALTGYSFEYFPSKTTQSHLLLRKDKIMPNIWPEIPSELSFWRRQACHTLSKALDISSATAWVALDLLKALARLSDQAFIQALFYSW